MHYLVVITFVASITSLMLSCTIIWPQWKDRLAVVRDVVLWAALAALVFNLLNQRDTGHPANDRFSSSGAYQLQETLPAMTYPVEYP